MDKNDLESKKLPELRDLAKMLGIEGTEAFKKPELIEAIAGGSSGINSILRFYYQIDGGSWVKFEDKQSLSSSFSSGTASVSSLSFSSTFQLKVEGFTSNANAAFCNIDNNGGTLLLCDLLHCIAPC